MKLAKTVYTDDEMVAALREAFAAGADRENAGDRLQPANLLAFYNGLPRPERDRLMDVATKSVGTINSRTGPGLPAEGNTPPASSDSTD
jgi:hypothetical protein